MKEGRPKMWMAGIPCLIIQNFTFRLCTVRVLKMDGDMNGSRGFAPESG